MEWGWRAAVERPWNPRFFVTLAAALGVNVTNTAPEAVNVDLEPTAESSLTLTARGAVSCQHPDPQRNRPMSFGLDFGLIM